MTIFTCFFPGNHFQIENISKRKGNWVHKFKTDDDAKLFISAQFSRFQEVEEFIKENFENLKGGKK